MRLIKQGLKMEKEEEQEFAFIFDWPKVGKVTFSTPKDEKDFSYLDKYDEEGTLKCKASKTRQEIINIRADIRDNGFNTKKLNGLNHCDILNLHEHMKDYKSKLKFNTTEEEAKNRLDFKFSLEVEYKPKHLVIAIHEMQFL